MNAPLLAAALTGLLLSAAAPTPTRGLAEFPGPVVAGTIPAPVPPARAAALDARRSPTAAEVSLSGSADDDADRDEDAPRANATVPGRIAIDPPSEACAPERTTSRRRSRARRITAIRGPPAEPRR